MPPDVVYVVRPGEVNPELRYSLRSLVNVPHGTVWMAGHRPHWVSRTVRHIRVAPRHPKAQSSNANLRAACDHPEVGEDFLLFNDDFFVVKPVKGVPALHCGTVGEHMGQMGGGYRRAAEGTRDLLVSWGHPDPLSYELHLPMPLLKPAMAELLEWAKGTWCLHHRTLYGNVVGIGGRRTEDVKVYDRDQVLFPPGPFVSTDDRSWQGRVGAWVRSLFPDPSPYEEA